MNQTFQDDNVIDVQLHSETECIAQDYTVHYTIAQLEIELGVKRRQIFNYAKIIKDAHPWEDERVFNPSLGKYSQRCLDEMKKLQQLGTDEYMKTVSQESGKYSPSAGALAKVETTSTVQRLAAKPLPVIPVVNIPSVDTSIIRSRTQQMQGLNGQVDDVIAQLITQKVEDKFEELDANLDDYFTEIELKAKAAALRKFQQRQTGG